MAKLNRERRRLEKRQEKQARKIARNKGPPKRKLETRSPGNDPLDPVD